MGTPRALSVWQYVQPAAEATTAETLQPRLDKRDAMLREQIQKVKDDLDLAKDHIQAIETALDGKASLVHGHPINQIQNLSARLASIEARLTALEGP